MISLLYFCPSPAASMISLPAIVISAVSMPYGQNTEQRRHSEHWL